jgi:hypothetical protein
MKIVCAYNHNHQEIKKLIGMKVKSYNRALALLKAGDHITIKTDLGYKSVGRDDDGTGWIQRRFSPEY